jgi:hypothetical protein
MGKYFVICDPLDPGAEFDTYEEAQEYVVECQKHSPGAIIVGPQLAYDVPHKTCKCPEIELCFCAG